MAMYYLTSCECSVCKEQLKETDEVVVCPICGTPYHRNCYDKSGECLFVNEHSKGYVYISPNAKKVVAPKNNENIKCEGCGHVNNHNNIFCDNCGVPLHAQHPKYTSPDVKDKVDDLPFLPGLPPIDRNDIIDDIEVNDWLEYTGNSGAYYVYQFKSMDATHRKTSICWSAVFFPMFYFFYRKMWLYGAIAAAVSILANVPTILFMLQDSGVMALGINPTVLTNLNYFGYILYNMASVACGIFSIYLYRKSAGALISKKRKMFNDQNEYKAWLKKSSGPSPIALGAVIGFIVISMFMLVQFIGPEYFMNLSLMM